MRSFLLLIYMLTALLVVCFVVKSFRRTKPLGAKVGRILTCCLVIILGYSVNLMTEQYFLMSCGNTAVFLGIDAMLIFYIDYLYEFLRFHLRHRRQVMILVGSIGAIDCIILLMNPFREIALTYKESYFYGILLHEYVPYFLYQMHLLFCYLMILVICILLIAKCTKIPSLYWYRYLFLLASTGITVGANAVFLATGLKLDLSVLIYGANAVSIYFVTFVRMPEVVLSNVHKTMLSCLDAPMILFDCEDYYVESNEDFRTIFSTINVNSNTMSLEDFILQAGFKQTAKDFKKTMSFQWKCLERKKIYECKCMLLYSRSKKKKGTLILFHDITSLIEAYEGEENAKKANSAKSEFLANMSHEIRTPINAILGMDEIILRESEDEAVLNYAAAIETSGRTLLALVNDILDFSKIESGKIDIVPVEYQLSSTLNDLVNMMSQRAKKKHLSLEIEADPKIPDKLYGDEVRIRQIVMNLLSNAIKYTDAGTVKLFVRFRWLGLDKKEVELYLAVKDTGRGIKNEDLARLFQSFERVDIERNRSVEGTGLGLAITKKFVELMHGSVGVESEYGRGSKFYARIPQKVISETPMGDIQEKFQKNVEKKRYERSFLAPDARILLVDDNDINLMVEENLMKQTQVKVDAAESGKAALELLQTNQYDLILLDHMMPEMDGVETLKQMREKHLAEGVPVVVLTANAVSGAKDMYLEYGFQDYLSKPISGHHLERALMKWLPANKVIRLSNPSEDDHREMADVSSVHLDKIIDVGQAMMYTNDGMSGVMQNIKLYMEHIKSSEEKLREAFEAEDYAGYRICIHAMKGSSALIGARKLSEFAAALENECKAGNSTYVIRHHVEFVQMQEHLYQQLHQFLLCQPELEKTPEQETVNDTLARLIQEVQNWDTVMIGEELNHLKKRIPADWYANLEKAYESMDFVQLRRTAEQYLKSQQSM